MERRYVGIDPGQTGAAVIVGDDGLSILDIIRWRGAHRPPEILAVTAADLIAVEDQYGGAYPRSALELREWTVRLLVSLPDGAVVLRPLASQWRPKVFRGSAPRGRKACKSVAREAARASFERAGQTMTDDSAEAWCLARYAWGYARAFPERVTGPAWPTDGR